MTEQEIKNKSDDITQREIQLALAEKNIESMRRLHEDYKHVTDTMTMKKFAITMLDALKEEGHICSQKERLTRIETIVSESKAVAEETLKELIVAKNSQEHRITKLETSWKVSTGIIISVIAGSWVVFTWSFDKILALVGR